MQSASVRLVIEPERVLSAAKRKFACMSELSWACYRLDAAEVDTRLGETPLGRRDYSLAESGNSAYTAALMGLVDRGLNEHNALQCTLIIQSLLRAGNIRFPLSKTGRTSEFTPSCAAKVYKYAQRKGFRAVCGMMHERVMSEA